MSFTHLHRHSEYSLKDGIGTADQYVAKAKENGQTALALTDHATMAGALHHIKACTKEGILPICGVEAYFRPDRTIRDSTNKQSWHMVLLARNMRGWKNLMAITTEAYLTGFYGRPCVDWELLEKYSEGLFATTACINSYYNDLLLQTQDTSGPVAACLEHYQRIFGEYFAMELMPHGFDEQRTLNVELANIAKRKGIPLIATVDAHYPYQEWAKTQEAVFMAGLGMTDAKTQKRMEDGEKVYTFSTDTFYLMSEEELKALFAQEHPDLPVELVAEAIGNTQGLVQDCFQPYAISRATKLPRTATSTEDALRTLKIWCHYGLEKIDKIGDLVYLERMDYELRVLEEKGVVDYFVIVGDMVRWAKSQHIRVGAGRGSAAGCLVSYLIGITACDPIAYDLLFERFLNPGRQGLPDIDIDFQDNRREEVKDYLAGKYGEDHVANIAAYGTYGPKSALKDLARVRGINHVEINKVTTSIEIPPTDTTTTLVDVRRDNEIVDAFARTYPQIYEDALRISSPRQVATLSQHAAGVVITPEPITNYMPLVLTPKTRNIVTAWSDTSTFPIISDFGFVKIDVLSTDGLTKQAMALNMIEEVTGERPDLDALSVMHDPYQSDPQVMQAFRNGLTLGVFQFGRRSITKLIKQVQPDTVLDVIAVNALHRPGPIAQSGEFARRKTSGDITYWHESVSPFLEETYGLLIYQEQVMRISQQLGGFSLTEADDLRKAMGKLYRQGMPAVIAFMEEHGYDRRFVEGASRFVDPVVAEEIWRQMLSFGGYGFNKAHSVAYGLQAYQDMWLKTYYPLQFYAALLTKLPARKEDSERVLTGAIREAKTLGIKILPPSVNTSQRTFTVDVPSNGIRYGLNAVSHIGDVGVASIQKHRPYHSREDFRARVPPREVNKKALDALIASGAFDWDEQRENWTDDERREGELLNIGIALTGDKVSEYADFIKRTIHTEDEVEAMEVGRPVFIGGEVTRVKRHVTRGKKTMAFVEICYGASQYDCVVWPEMLDAFAAVLEPGKGVLARGRKDKKNVVLDYIDFVEQVAHETRQEAA